MGGLGYSIGRNKPYAGGFITEHYGNPASGLHTVQLELNRAIYMDERRRERSPRFAQVVADFAVLADSAGGGAARRSRPVPGGSGVGCADSPRHSGAARSDEPGIHTHDRGYDCAIAHQSSRH